VIESFDGDLVIAERGTEPVNITAEFCAASSSRMLILRSVNMIATDNNVAIKLSSLRLLSLTGDSGRTTNL
jgi:hypothetical protein